MIPMKVVDKTMKKKGRPSFGQRIAGNTPKASLATGSNPPSTPGSSHPVGRHQEPAGTGRGNC